MLELALHYGKGPMLLKNIAKRQDISEGYLEHIMPPLKTAGLINSSRGAHGGYTLAKPPQDITLKDIILTMEGSLSLVECVDNHEACSRISHCVTRDIWNELSEKISETLQTITLNDLAKRQMEKTESPLAYYI